MKSGVSGCLGLEKRKFVKFSLSWWYGHLVTKERGWESILLMEKYTKLSPSIYNLTNCLLFSARKEMSSSLIFYNAGAMGWCVKERLYNRFSIQASLTLTLGGKADKANE